MRLCLVMVGACLAFSVACGGDGGGGSGDDPPEPGACEESNQFANVCPDPSMPSGGSGGVGGLPPEPFPELACPVSGARAPERAACGAEVDLESDSENCLVCGRSCGGRACTAGGCAPEVVYQSDTVQSGTAILRRGDDVLWADTSGKVFQLVPGAAPLTVLQAVEDTRRLILCDDVFYWVGDFALYAQGFDETASRRLASLSDVLLLACHPGEGVLYALVRNSDLPEGETDAIFRLVLPDGAPEMLVGQQPLSRDLQVDADKLVWATDDAIRVFHKDSATVELLVSGLDHPHHLQLDRGYLYWVVGQTDEPQAIQRTSTTCGAIDVVAPDAGDGIFGISVDEQYVYWSNWSVLYRAALSGDWPELIGGAEKFAPHLTHTTDSLFWFEDHQAYRLMRAPK